MADSEVEVISAGRYALYAPKLDLSSKFAIKFSAMVSLYVGSAVEMFLVPFAITSHCGRPAIEGRVAGLIVASFLQEEV